MIDPLTGYGAAVVAKNLVLMLNALKHRSTALTSKDSQTFHATVYHSKVQPFSIGLGHS